MKLIIEMYNLTPSENKNKSKKLLKSIHLDDIKHFAPVIKRIVEEEFEDYNDEIILRLKKFKNGKHKIYYTLIENSNLKRHVENFIESSFPIIC
jgi:hypothetical protein